MIQIDGSIGEGGGQILRTSLGLSMFTGKPFKIINIRSHRRKSGLMRQHLTAVKAAQTICQAEVTGAEISSGSLEFKPRKPKSGDYHFAVGTAGSATLVLQTILPPLLCADRVSNIILEGGTHNPWAPPFHFIKQSFVPMLKLMGVQCETELNQWGFYPAGGGKFSFRVTPTIGGPNHLYLSDRGKLIRSEVIAAVSKIPWEVAEDEANLISQQVNFRVDQLRPQNVSSPGPGNVAMLYIEFENSNMVISSFGELGVSRKKVAHKLASTANRLFQSGVAVDEYLADQLLVPMAIAGGGSFTTLKPSNHTLTNIEVIKKFLKVNIICSQTDKEVWKIEIS